MSLTNMFPADFDKEDAAFSRRAALGLGLIMLLIVGFGGWAATSNLAGAVIAAGHVAVDSSVKKIQHPTGGIVGLINAKTGDRVDSGDLLVRLDDTQTRANLGIINAELAELLGRRARLAAERDGADTVTFPEDLETDFSDGARVIAGETRLFEARRRSHSDQLAQLRERAGQFKSEIVGLRAQEEAKSIEVKLVKEELERVTDMHARALVPETRLLQIQRDVARVGGEDGALLSQIARAEGQVSETELRIIELDATARAEAQKELRDVEARTAELMQKRIAAEDILKRIEIRAPIAGIVHELQVHTIGGVISPGEAIMGLVPLGDAKVIDVRIAPTDVDQVTIGQKVVLKFSAFNQHTTPELQGTLDRLASDVTRDPQTGVSYYSARIRVDDAEFGKINDLKLVAGMPVEGFIQTGERSALSYLLKPFRDQLDRAFREE